MQMLAYSLNGSHGSAKACQGSNGSHPSWPCTQASWSAVIPKEKLVYGVGWYNTWVNLSAVQRTGKPQEPVRCNPYG